MFVSIPNAMVNFSKAVLFERSMVGIALDDRKTSFKFTLLERSIDVNPQSFKVSISRSVFVLISIEPIGFPVA